jgi:hypothetical protein
MIRSTPAKYSVPFRSAKMSAHGTKWTFYACRPMSVLGGKAVNDFDVKEIVNL